MFVLAILLSISAYSRYTAERETREKRVDRAHELEELNMRAAALESKVNHLESERGIENAIREQFDVAKEGEEVIVVVDESAKNAGVEKQEVFPLPQKPSLFSWLKFW